MTGWKLSFCRKFAIVHPPTTTPLTMISRSAVTRGTQLALRRQGCAFAQRRGYAAAAAIGSESGSYEPTDIAGIKVAHKDAHGPTTKLAVVAKAGTRYQPLPGLTIGLEEFAFKVRDAAENFA